MRRATIENIVIGKLRPHPANARTHSKKQISQIARGIEKFGFTNPVVADENHNILAGHGRLLAAKQLELTTVPVMLLAGLTEAEKRAFLLFDNKVSENSGWDRRALAHELEDLAPLLSEEGLDIGLTGFEAPEIDRLLGDYIDPEQDPADDIPQNKGKPVSREGDLWRLDQHRLVCGDARDEAAFRRLMARDRADMIIADPPYNLPARSIQGRGRIRHRNFVAGSGELSSSEFSAFLSESLALAVKFSRAGSLHYVFMDWRHMGELRAAADDVYGDLVNLCVWVKPNSGQGSFYRSRHELIFVFRNGDAPHQNNIELGRHGRNRSNVWEYAGINSFRAGRLDDLAAHPTVKPVALAADAMRDCTRRGDVVLDPFLGSGTTILAAERTGRRSFGIELDPKYVDVAIRRWQDFTKADAIFTATGQTFGEVMQRRRGSDD
jgi:DNA modification methylase